MRHHPRPASTTTTVATTTTSTAQKHADGQPASTGQPPPSTPEAAAAASHTSRSLANRCRERTRDKDATEEDELPRGTSTPSLVAFRKPSIPCGILRDGGVPTPTGNHDPTPSENPCGYPDKPRRGCGSTHTDYPHQTSDVFAATPDSRQGMDLIEEPPESEGLPRVIPPTKHGPQASEQRRSRRHPAPESIGAILARLLLQSLAQRGYAVVTCSSAVRAAAEAPWVLLHPSFVGKGPTLVKHRITGPPRSAPAMRAGGFMARAILRRF